jgi:hypothetical protein
MPNTDFGPINIVQGNSAQFMVEFLDMYGNLTVPSSGTIYISYTNTSNTSQTDTVALSVVNSFFTGIWSSTSASYGIATWSAYAAGSTSVQQTGYIRVIDP